MIGVPQIIKPQLYRGWAPSGQPTVDRSNPLTHSLTSVLWPQGNALIDLVRARPLMTGGTAIMGRSGPIVDGGWTLGVAADTADLNWTTGGFTVAVFAKVLAQNTTDYQLFIDRSAYTSETNNQGWVLRVNPTTDSSGYDFLIFANSTSATYNFNSTVAVVAGDRLVAATGDGTTKALYVDGVVTTSTSADLLPASCGNALNAVSTTPQGLYIAYTWNRALTAVEINSLSAAPFQFLVFPQDILQALLTGVIPSLAWGYDTEKVTPISRKRFFTLLQDDPVWPSTVVATPTTFGWQEREIFPTKFRLREPPRDDVVLVPPVAVSTVPQGWDVPPTRPPSRRQITRRDQEDPAFSRTVVITPSQFGWEVFDKPPTRRRPQGNALAEGFTAFPPAAVTPTAIGFDPVQTRPQRSLPRPLQNEQVVFIPPTVPTPSQFGFEDSGARSTPRRLWRQLSNLGREEFIGVPQAAVVAAVRVVRAALVRVGFLKKMY